MILHNQKYTEGSETALTSSCAYAGESDTRDLALAESYGARLEQLIANVRTPVGSTASHLAKQLP